MKWLDRTLLRGPCVALCLSERDFNRECRRFGAPKPWPAWLSTGANATTHTFEKSKSRKWTARLSCIVCLAPDHKKNHPNDVRALLVHEATHVWQHAQQAGELDGCETEAYAIQNVSTVLMDEYDRVTKPKRQKQKRKGGRK